MQDLYDRIAELEQAVADLKAGMMNIASRGTLSRNDDSTGLQQMTVKGHYGEELKGVQRWGQHGFTSVAPAGSDALILSLNGNRDEAQILGTINPKSRPTGGEPGSATMYDDAGNMLHFDNAGNATLTTSAKFTVKAPEIVLDGNVTLGGAAGSGVPASKEGTVTSDGARDVGNLATKVKVN